MARLIDIEKRMEEWRALQAAHYPNHPCQMFHQFLLSAPTVDAVPVVQGKWIDEIEPNAVTASGREVHIFRCSACDFTWANKTAVLHYFKYCPNCGAKMDGGAKNV